ncbi:MAG TPA: beta galactosidase jelly roll domain-containing protein, partial [Pyrinomonadaceae bacterium]
MKVGVFFVVMFACVAARAQPSALANAGGRHALSLDGRWQTIIDPYENGFYDYRYRESPNGYFKNAKPKTPGDLVEYDFDDSPQMYVPGDWNSQDERLLFYEGTVWYKKSFDYQRRPGTRLFVHFGGANYEAVVYLNGEKLGRHEGGFTPFNFEVTPLVRERDNFLVVKVDNKRRRDAVPTLNTDWWNYGGLTRSVNLVEVPDAFIRDYFIQLRKGSRDEVVGWVQLEGASAGARVAVSMPEAGVSETFTADVSGRAPVSFKARLNLWSPESPKLYQVKLS